mmetsp:Transcript_34649/g.101844  ORF Transcript_34649/g.101844 Transcript_34649/m.101844 type:complete len:420 (-) Transcript_34649:185-1444(-)
MPLRNLSTLADALDPPSSSSTSPTKEQLSRNIGDADANEVSGPEAKRARVGPSRDSLPGTDASDCEEDEKDTTPADQTSLSTPSSPNSSSWMNLPAELWATHILIFLPYVDMIRSSTVNKTFLKEFAPRIKEIDVESPDEMKAAMAKRFRGVETMRIRCLFSHCGDRVDEDDEDSDLIVEHDVVGLIAPFLAYFPALKLAHVGIFDPQYRDYGALESAHRRTDESDRLMQSLHTSICGAYRTGSISSNVEIIGADCPCQNYGHEDHSDQEEDEDMYRNTCGLCIDYCKSYPMTTVADTSHCKQFPVCLSIQDTIGIILKRPGGREYLTSTEYFIRKHIDLTVRDSALVRVLREMGLVPEKITRQDVEDVLMNEKGYSIAHTCNEQELSFFHESGITCLERSDFRSVRPVAPTDSRGIWW